VDNLDCGFGVFLKKTLPQTYVESPLSHGASDISRVTIPILAVAIVACFHRILVALASSDLIDK
jgi:hypothetical protein